MQPIIKDAGNRARFRPNKIVRYLLERAREINVDMNHIHDTLDFSDEDRRQFAQLIGYSLSGYSELPYVSDEAYETALKMSLSEKSEVECQNEYRGELIKQLKDALLEPMARLFEIDQDDLKGK